MNIAHYMLASAERQPHAVALADETTELTFVELRNRAEALAGTLIARNIRPGDAIAILLDRSCNTIVAMHAALMCGAVYCPLDTKAPPTRIKTMLERLAPAIVLHDGTGIPSLEDWPSLHVVERVLQSHVDERMAAELRKRIDSTIDSDPAYVIFTSGSTGEPKGVTIPHGGVQNYIAWACEFTKLGPSDRIAGQAPFFFDNSVLDIYLAMAVGATLDIFPAHVFTFPRRLADDLAQRGITFIFWVPSALAGIASSGWFDSHTLTALRHIVFAGEVMPPATLSRWMAAMPGARFSNLYGPTEITVDCTWYDVPENYSGEPVPIGFPLPNTEILLVGDQDLPAPEGQIGEMLVRGTGVALGYWNRPDLTANAFIQNPCHTRYSDRTYRTGDLAYRDPNGCLHFVGRRDNQIKRRGYRIELGDVEHALDGTPGIAASAVVYDLARDKLVLCVVSEADLELTTVRKYLKDKLPAYMLPDAMVRLERLPVNANGKIDRKTLLNVLDTPND